MCHRTRTGVFSYPARRDATCRGGVPWQNLCSVAVWHYCMAFSRGALRWARRTTIPKGPGTVRSLGIPTLADQVCACTRPNNEPILDWRYAIGDTVDGYLRPYCRARDVQIHETPYLVAIATAISVGGSRKAAFTAVTAAT